MLAGHTHVCNERRLDLRSYLRLLQYERYFNSAERCAHPAAGTRKASGTGEDAVRDELDESIRRQALLSHDDFDKQFG